MHKDEVMKKVTACIVDTCSLAPEKVTGSATLKKDLALDSLDSVELIMNLEELFDIAIEDEEAEKFTTVDELVKYIISKRSV